MDDFRIVEELTIGDKKRRWLEIIELQKNMDVMDPRLLPLMQESNDLLRDMTNFMNNFCQNINDELDRKND